MLAVRDKASLTQTQVIQIIDRLATSSYQVRMCIPQLVGKCLLAVTG